MSISAFSEIAKRVKVASLDELAKSFEILVQNPWFIQTQISHEWISACNAIARYMAYLRLCQKETGASTSSLSLTDLREMSTRVKDGVKADPAGVWNFPTETSRGAYLEYFTKVDIALKSVDSSKSPER